jgi:hypothetical protein
MGNPVYKCPHCKGAVEVELTEQGHIRLKIPILEGTPE